MTLPRRICNIFDQHRPPHSPPPQSSLISVILSSGDRYQCDIIYALFYLIDPNMSHEDDEYRAMSCICSIHLRLLILTRREKMFRRKKSSRVRHKHRVRDPLRVFHNHNSDHGSFVRNASTSFKYHLQAATSASRTCLPPPP